LIWLDTILCEKVWKLSEICFLQLQKNWKNPISPNFNPNILQLYIKVGAHLGHNNQMRNFYTLLCLGIIAIKVHLYLAVVRSYWKWLKRNTLIIQRVYLYVVMWVIITFSLLWVITICNLSKGKRRIKLFKWKTTVYYKLTERVYNTNWICELNKNNKITRMNMWILCEYNKIMLLWFHSSMMINAWKAALYDLHVKYYGSTNDLN
jgi:hypothetical protein